MKFYTIRYRTNVSYSVCKVLVFVKVMAPALRPCWRESVITYHTQCATDASEYDLGPTIDRQYVNKIRSVRSYVTDQSVNGYYTHLPYDTGRFCVSGSGFGGGMGDEFDR